MKEGLAPRLFGLAFGIAAATVLQVVAFDETFARALVASIILGLGLAAYWYVRQRREG